MAAKGKYQDNFPEVAEEYLAKGHSKQALCGKLGIHKDTLYTWIKEKPAFSDAIKRGVNRGLSHFEDKLLDKINRGDLTALIFTLKTRFHKVYGDKTKHEVETTQPIEIKYVRREG